MGEPAADTLTRSVWLDRVVMTAFVLVFGVLFIRSAIDPGAGGQAGVDWWQLAMGFVSVAFWGALAWVVGSALGVL